MITNSCVDSGEVNNLTQWCHENNLSLNVNKAKELIGDYRRRSGRLDPTTINRSSVELVNSFKILSVHITEELSWGDWTESERHSNACFILGDCGSSAWVPKSHGLSMGALSRASFMDALPPGMRTAWPSNAKPYRESF